METDQALLLGLGLALTLGAVVIALAWWLGGSESFLGVLARVATFRLFPSARQRRRAALLREPFPADWQAHVERSVRVHGLLKPSEQQKLRDCLRLLIAEKEWEGCGGLELTDEVRVTIAALAAVPLLGRDIDDYEHVTSVLVYPSAFQIPGEHEGHGGDFESDIDALGQAVYRGPVILAWDDVLASCRAETAGRNVVYHEFAHQLDFLGDWDRRPRGRRWRRWQKVMLHEYRVLVRAALERRPTLLDRYGATNPAEFFAVATESFFEQPAELARERPDLYDALRDFYNQDPAGRLGEGGGDAPER